MATILYKGDEKAVIEADQVPGYLKNGWSVEDKPVKDKSMEDKPKASTKK